MTKTIRMFPPVSGNKTVVINGRTYDGTASSFRDAPDFDALRLSANGWTTGAPVGTTGQRPAAAQGAQFIDTTLGYLIICDGTAWRDPATGDAV